MQTGELQGVEDLPTKSLAELKTNKNVTLLPLPNWWIQIALSNVSAPPTDNLDFRRRCRRRWTWTRSWMRRPTATTG